jgi:hypothetical protein
VKGGSNRTADEKRLPLELDEWTVDREDGARGFNLSLDGGDIWLETREQDEDGQWSEWEREDLDGPGADLLARMPHLLKLERDEERAACAETVRAAKCLCKGIYLVKYPAYPDDYKHVSPERTGRHFEECPCAIAERIEARGKE